MSNGTSLIPVTPEKSASAIHGMIERVIASVPKPQTMAVADPHRQATLIARKAAKRSAMLSGALALPPGPIGMLTVLPDLYLIWQTQRQMVADIFGLYGRSAELTRVHMLYCLFRHAASQVLRDVAVRTGQRMMMQQLSSSALKHVVSKIGANVTRRLTGNAASRWVPLAGAAAVSAYAYWDTLQVARTARRLLTTSADDDRTFEAERR
ncbi:MAG: hypothetical protein WKH97_01180 [Casimicrobiaceae bacterium]